LLTRIPSSHSLRRCQGDIFGAPDEVFRRGVPDGQRRILYHLNKYDRKLKVSIKTPRNIELK